jgi:PAS domain S-box-containing protein
VTGVDPAFSAQETALLEVIPGAIICVSSDGSLVFANAAAAGLFGYERDALINVHLGLLIPGSFCDDFLKEDRSGAGPPAQPDSTARLMAGRHQDGSEFAVEVMMTRTQKGARAVAMVALRHARKRKRAVDAFRGAREVADDAAVAVDSLGHIALVNPEAEKLFGYSSTELIDHPVNMLVPQPSSDPAARSESGRAPGQQAEQVGIGTALEGRRKDGSEFPVEITLSAIDSSEGPLVSASIRDASVTTVAQREQERDDIQLARDLLETRLHQSHRLESLGQLAGGVAHDFNNLLAAILNYASFVAAEIGVELQTRPDDERVRLTAVLKDVAEIGSAAERAATLTHQLLLFARREVRHLEVLDINDIVREVETLLRRTIGEHVTLVTGGAADLKAVRADRGQMEQILLNLAVNARDAMPFGGILSVVTENFTVDGEYATLHPLVDAGPYVRIRVTDTGDGMDEATIDRAFEPFFSTKPKDKGTGLGLATVYGIVSQTGGLVELRSEVGAGTTVTILLPSVAASVTEPEPPRPIKVRGSGETILVVEDEEPVLDVASRILAQHGYQVLVARSGAEAFEVIERHPGTIDLLLTDVVMPRTTGKEVADRIALRRPDTRVLYMSGYPEAVIASEGVVDQGIRLMSKPFQAEDLLDHVRAVLDE